MREFSKLRFEDLNAEGRVTIRYIDLITSRVKEEIKGKNYVFKDHLFTPNWFSLMSTGYPLVITDSRVDVDPNFPFLKGKFIGYGIPGQTSSGNYRGRYVPEQSYTRQFSPGGKISSKYTFEFTPTQALGELGQIGLTYQYASFTNGNTDSYFKNFFIGSNKPGSRGVIKGSSVIYDVLYSTSPYRLIPRVYRGVIYPMDQPVEEYQFSISQPYSNYAIAPSIDSSKIYLIGRTSANLLIIHEFADDTDFSTPLNTYQFTAEINPTFNQYAAAYLRKIFLFPNVSSNNQYWIVDLDTQSVVSKSISDWVISGTIFNPGSVTIDSQYIYVAPFSTSGVGSTYYGIIIDSFTGDVVSGLSVSGTYQACIVNPYQEGLAWFSMNQSFPTATVSNALTVFKVPDDTPPRPQNYGMTITYELEIQY